MNQIPIINATDPHKFAIAESRGFVAVLHNDIVKLNRYRLEKNAGQSLSLNELKILLYCISRIKPEDTELLPMEFDIKEFYEICGIDATQGAHYKQLKDSLAKLASRVMWLCSPTKEKIVRWIDDLTIEKNGRKSKITMCLDPSMKPYLICLRANYTTISLHSIIRMKSAYGIMLYLILKGYCYSKISTSVTFELQDIRERLDCLTKAYDKFSNIRSRVLEPALKDLNTYSELKVSCSYVKAGQTITHITFTIEDLNSSATRLKEAEVRFRNVEKEIYLPQ